MEVGVTEHVVRSFNWKLLVENFSENFYTPFVHPQLQGAGWDYAIDVDGPIALAADRIKPGWEHVASAQADEPFLSGMYFTVSPNLIISVFPRYFHALIVTPVDAHTSRVDYHRCWAARWLTQSGSESASTAIAALRPFNAMTDPAGWVAAPQK
jgi:phenylpropionate dioxygenase-like ring-hydroxylating dioxygenase large terminal subunit